MIRFRAMASTSQVTLGKDCEIPLIGSFSSQIVGSKLPPKKQALKVLFFNLRVVKLNLQDNAPLTIGETVVFWEKARIPVHSEKKLCAKIETIVGRITKYSKMFWSPNIKLKTRLKSRQHN